MHQSVRPRPLGPSLAVSTVPVDWVAFSPDGHTLATSSDDGHDPALEPPCPVRHPTDLFCSRRPHARAVEPVHPPLAVPAILRALAPKVPPGLNDSGEDDVRLGQDAPVVGLVPPWPGVRMITTRAGPQEESTGRPTGLRRLPVPWAAQTQRSTGRARVGAHCRGRSDDEHPPGS